ncbi:MAG: helix-turn-helix transcriptional regulator [Flavobacteriaceae bacterium]|nr:helix-turn-helix transcriptional regulator [Flavobacteriaceae bacterium]
MTQEEFADWLGITRNMINSYERDKATPSIAILVALDTKLKIDINKLLKDILTIDNFSDFLRTPDATKDYIDSIASQH